MTSIANSVTSMLATAPEPLRAKYRDLTTKTLLARLAASRPRTEPAKPLGAAAVALKTMAGATPSSPPVPTPWKTT
ncbi:hypothetical protein F7P69_29060 [Cellulosimicrobium funkei]|nr:hypothetical protein [Cellulosimicrobium funkei]